MRHSLLLFVGIACAALGRPAAAQEPPADLRLACTSSARKANVGDDVTITVTLTNHADGGDPVNVLPLVFDHRSVTLLVHWTETPAVRQGETATPVVKQYELLRYPTQRNPPPALAMHGLAAGAAISGTFTLPCVRTGDLRVRARYRGYALAPTAQIESNDVELFVGSANGEKLGVTFQTAKGAIEVQIDRAQMPATVSQFVLNARAGLYDGTAFFRLMPGAWVQGGDAQTNDGTGDPGWTMPYEVPQDRTGRTHAFGTLSVSRGSGHFTGATQFFFSLRALPQYDFGSGYPHAAFGAVVKGDDVLRQIGTGEVEVFAEESPFAGEQSKPVAPVTCEKVTVWVR